MRAKFYFIRTNLDLPWTHDWCVRTGTGNVKIWTDYQEAEKFLKDMERFRKDLVIDFYYSDEPAPFDEMGDMLKSKFDEVNCCV